MLRTPIMKKYDETLLLETTVHEGSLEDKVDSPILESFGDKHYMDLLFIDSSPEEKKARLGAKKAVGEP